MTFFLGCYDLVSGLFTYGNASHDPPLLFRPIRGHYYLEQPTFLNKVNNPSLGGDVDSEFKEASFKLEKGDYILAHTDGVTDLPNPHHLHFGERRLMNTFFKSIQGTPPVEDVVKQITHKLFDFKQTTHLEDDVTFFVMHLG